jgi:hypothetical protein
MFISELKWFYFQKGYHIHFLQLVFEISENIQFLSSYLKIDKIGNSIIMN